MTSTSKPTKGFISLMAILMSFVALAIDSMLPALPHIGRDLQVQNPNSIQLVISSVFLGMGFGLMIFGPLSDSYGRKPAIYLGMCIFLIGCVASIFSTSFEIMILGRLLQGAGAASCRVVTLAMIRDKYSGNAMAKVMSLVMIIFILVPALAPTIGQAILQAASWRTIFVFMFVTGILGVLWLALGQEETLTRDKRVAFSLGTVAQGIKETLLNPISRSYTLASGFVFGAFIGYLSSAQQILQVQYQLGEKFVFAFGALALSIGAASFTNSRLVDRYGMVRLCQASLVVIVALAGLFLLVTFAYHGHPPLQTLLTYLLLTFFCFGILFGNFNALAIQPLGHIAGVANSVISALQTLLSVAVGSLVSYNYNGTIFPLISGFFVLGTCALLLVSHRSYADQRRRKG